MDLLKKLNNMITAQELLHQKFIIIQNDELNKKIINSMIEFAKLHVQKALKEASENIPGFGSSTDIPNWEEVEKEILNAYPLENIK